jgi:hypothetical protein
VWSIPTLGGVERKKSTFSDPYMKIAFGSQTINDSVYSCIFGLKFVSIPSGAEDVHTVQNDYGFG